MTIRDPNLAEIRANPQYQDAYLGEPLISVCIPTLNRARLLCERSLPSVLAQTYTNWEAIVVGDGGDDDTADRIAALGDARLHFFNLTTNGPYPDNQNARWQVAGTYAANEAAERARGRWIAVNNDDDDWSPDHLAVLLAEAQRTHAEIVYGRLRVAIDGTGEESSFGTWPPQLGDFAFQSALVHADLRGFRADINAYKLGEPGDWNLARRMVEAGARFAFLPQIVGTYHLSAGHIRQQSWSDRARRETRMRNGTDIPLPNASEQPDIVDDSQAEVARECASLEVACAEIESTLSALHDERSALWQSVGIVSEDEDARAHDDAVRMRAEQFAQRNAQTTQQLRAYREFLASVEQRRITQTATRDALRASNDALDAEIHHLNEMLQSRAVSLTIAAEQLTATDAKTITAAKRARSSAFAADTDIATRNLATLLATEKAALDAERTSLRQQLREREDALADLLGTPRNGERR